MEAEDKAAWHKALDHGQLADGNCRPIEVAGRRLCISKVNGRYGAIDDRCPHQGGSLGEGWVQDGWVLCSWHRWEFHPETGKGWEDDIGVKAYEVEEREDGIWVKLPPA